VKDRILTIGLPTFVVATAMGVALGADPNVNMAGTVGVMWLFAAGLTWIGVEWTRD
jgi:hypothetical protein